MRKYRYIDPNSTIARNRVIGQVIKFFIGWNIIGYVAWQYMKNKARELDPDFDKKRPGEQMLSMFGYKDTKMTPVKIKVGLDGFHVTKMEAKSDVSSEITNSNNPSSRTTEGKQEPKTESKPDKR